MRQEGSARPVGAEAELEVPARCQALALHPDVGMWCRVACMWGLEVQRCLGTDEAVSDGHWWGRSAQAERERTQAARV